MNMKARLIVGFALVFGIIGIAMNVLSYPELEDEDIFEADETEQLFAAANAEYPLFYDPKKPAGRGLFPDGLRDIGPAVPIQNKICDCRFVAALSSLASTETGKQAIFNMAVQQTDGSTVVTFPGAKTEPVTIAPITPKEALVVSYVRKDGACVPTMWVSIIEKAYGHYRAEHQGFFESLLHCLRHSIFYGKWTDQPLADATAASYGMSDDKAISLLTGDSHVVRDTFSFLCGDFGLGKGCLTWTQMKSWFNRPGVRQEVMEKQHELFVREGKSGLMGVVLTDLANQNSTVKLRQHHAFAILGYDAQKRRITLRDPYGNGDFLDPVSKRWRSGRNDGIFDLSLEELNSYASHLVIRTKS